MEEQVWYGSRNNQLSSFPALFLFAVFFPTLCALLFGDLSMFIFILNFYFNIKIAAALSHTHNDLDARSHACTVFHTPVCSSP